MSTAYSNELLSNSAAFMTFTDWLNPWRVPVNATFTVWRSINDDVSDYTSSNQTANHSAPCRRSRSVASTTSERNNWSHETVNFTKLLPLPFLHPFRIREVVEIISWRPPETHNVTVHGAFPLLHPRGSWILRSQLPMLFLMWQVADKCITNVAYHFAHDKRINADIMRSTNKYQYSKQILNSHAINDRWWIFTRTSDR